jgi:hypothetical protein
MEDSCETSNLAFTSIAPQRKKEGRTAIIEAGTAVRFPARMWLICHSFRSK